VECVTTAMHNGKRQVRPLIDHFERPPEEACPNHMYPIKHKLKDCSMIKNFMTPRSLTRDMEPEEDLGRSNVMPFPGLQMSNLSQGTMTHCGLGPGMQGCKGMSFTIYIYYRYYSSPRMMITN
jgi:hypothetical protein